MAELKEILSKPSGSTGYHNYDCRIKKENSIIGFYTV